MASLDIFYQNVRGLRTKTKEFLTNVLNSDYDVICITETWLHPGIFDSELFDPRYSVYRVDRDYDRLGLRMGGGVLVAVRRGLALAVGPPSEPPPLPGAPDVLCVGIALDSSGVVATNYLYIFCCYFPQNKDQVAAQQLFLDYLADLSDNMPNSEFVILGDFNIPDAIWDTQTINSDVHFLTNPSFNLLTNQLFSFMCYKDWSQYNGIKNHNNRCLDLVISSRPCLVHRARPLALPEDAHHPSLSVQCVLARSVRELCPSPRTIRKYFAADYDAVNNRLSNINWRSLLSTTDINSAVDTFYGVLNTVISEYIPEKKITGDSKYPVWYSSQLIKLIKKKIKVHKKWKCYNRLSDYVKFSELRKKTKELSKDCYNLFISRAETNIKSNPKLFWAFIKSKKSVGGIPDTLYFRGSHASDGQSIANLFNSYFHSVFESEACASPLSLHGSNTIINSIEFTPDIVLRYLRQLDISKGGGPDGLHPVFLKRCCSELAYPVSFLFNLSLSSGIMPPIWKRSIVVPIFKSGDRHDMCNYRGISKISILPKIFEKIIYDSLFPAIRPFLIAQQHGFIDKRSTETNLCEYLDIILDSMDKGFQVDAVYTDYSKAFDKISHSLLIYKIERIGIHGDLLRWLSSYLRDRSQAVAVKGFTSCFVPITSGVPQGSHLGPLLFNIFINDVLDCFRHSSVLLYADDTKIFTRIKSVQDCIHLQEDLNALNEYCLDNKLFLNVSKCCIISFSRKKTTIQYDYTINNSILNRVTEVRDLGVFLDSKLLFRSHFEKITAKAYKMLGFLIRQTADFKDINTFIILYNALVRSHLEYASVTWNPQYDKYKHMLQRIQDKFCKRLKFKFKTSPPVTLLSLETRREHRDIIFLYKILNNHIDSSYLLNEISFNCPKYIPRSNRAYTFAIPFCRTNYASNRFVVRTCRLYNNNYNMLDIFYLKPDKFKTVIKQLR